MKQIKIGTRGSKLALVQANLAAEAFQKLGYDTQLVVVHTRGDANLNASLSEIGRGAFTDVFAQMLAEGKLDVAVHSAKDLPTTPDRDGFCLPARPTPEIYWCPCRERNCAASAPALPAGKRPSESCTQKHKSCPFVAM